MDDTTQLPAHAMTVDEIQGFQHHKTIEEIGQILCQHAGKKNPKFFNILVAYYLGVVASSMRAKINAPAHGQEPIPVSAFVTAFAPSGYGKGKATNIMEGSVMVDFRTTFRDHVMPQRAEIHLWKLASKEAAKNGTDDQQEYDKFLSEYKRCGAYKSVFDGGSEAAIKQIRDQLIRADCGSINLQTDEIGQNLEKPSVVEAMNAFLELFDLGRIKDKLKVNSNDNKRLTEIEGDTPANMLAFGTPDSVFDAGSTEKRFMSLLEAGNGRRNFYGWGDEEDENNFFVDPTQIYDRRANPQNVQALQQWRNHFAGLADTSKIHWTLDMPQDASEELIRYEQFCKYRASLMPRYDTVERAEMKHRFFKALKLAGAFAFVEEILTITTDHIQAAIKLAEESGEAFNKIMNQDEPYMKLAKFLAESKNEMTHADLDSKLPFYKGTNPKRQDLLTLATAWGYRHHIVIKRRYLDNIELLYGETLEETDLDALHLSHSHHWAEHYGIEPAPFGMLDRLVTLPNHNWCNHAFIDNHRHGDKVVAGFNVAVFDIDGGSTLDSVHSLLEDYTFMTHTTKRHTPDSHRFRLILPLPYKLYLDEEDYKGFMDNLMDWLPIKADEKTNQRCKKWSTNEHAKVFYNKETKNDTNLVDVLSFIPRTSKNDQHIDQMKQLGSLDNLERWFAQRIATGNRNNHMIQFALALVDCGMSYQEVEGKVFAFNGKLSNPLSEQELRSTVLITVAKKYQSAA